MGEQRSVIQAGCILLLCLASLAKPVLAFDEPREQLRNVEQTLKAMRENYYVTGDLRSAVAPLPRAHAEAQAALDAFAAGSDRAGIAKSMILLGKIERALITQDPASMEANEGAIQKRFGEALAMARQSGDRGLQIQALNGLVVSLINSKNFAAAQEPVEQLVELAAEAGSADDKMDAHLLRAQLELGRGDLSASSDYLVRALDLANKVGNPYLIWNAYDQRASLEIERGEKCNYELDIELCLQSYQLALDDLQRAIDAAARAGYTFLANQTTRRRDATRLVREQFARLGDMRRKLGSMDFHASKPSQVLLSPRFAPGANPQLAANMRQWKAQHAPEPTSLSSPQRYEIEARLQEWEGDDDGALKSYRKAVELLDSDRRTLGDSQGSGAALASLVAIYHGAALQYLDRRDYASAFEMIERSRSRALAELLQQRNLSLGNPQEQSLYAQSIVLKARIGKEQSNLYDRAMANGTDTEAIRQLQSNIERLEQDYRALRAQMSGNPRLQNLVEAPTATLQSVQDLARRGNYELLYYLVMGQGPVIWHISPDAVHVVSVVYARQLLSNRVQKTYDSVADANRAFDQTDAQELFLELVNPILPYVKSRRLVIVPHEELNALPFQVLQDPGDGSFLGERFQITTVPSATVLSQLGKSPDMAKGRLLAFATPDVANSIAEVKAIASLYPGRAKVFTEKLVTKSELLGSSGEYNLVHLSVHGVFDSRDPLLSYLKLAPPGSAGQLSAADMFGLRLPKNSLVVLSACETGRVEGTHTNEALGMVRGLVYAGASALVLSSWKVDSKSTELWMETFYRDAQTKPLAEAAQLALIAVRRRPEFQHPFYWAPFQLTGS